VYRHIRTTFVSILLSLLLFACTTPPQPRVQTGPDAEVIAGDLHRVDNSSVSKAYIDPAFYIDDYEKVLIEPLDLSSVAVINPDYTNSDSTWQLHENDRDYLRERYRISMIKNFFGLGGYVAATAPGEGVLRIRVAISRVGPSLSDKPAAGSITRQHLTDSLADGGEVQISGIVDDSGTGNPVARFVDVRPCKCNWGASNELADPEQAKQLFESWARLFVFRLQENRKQNSNSGKSW